MALFTDGNPATISDLKDYESGVLEAATTERIDVGVKLAVAQREIGLEMAAFLLRRGVRIGPHRELDVVVVTEPLVHLHAIHTLSLIYRDAYNAQMNDRYQGKWKEYARLSEHAFRTLLDIGIGISNAPTRRASMPQLGSVAGGLQGPRTYFAAIAWANPYGTTGALSPCSMLQLNAQSLMSVMANSVPPAGATGWHLYVGPSESELSVQTPSPIQIGSMWTEPTTGISTSFIAPPVQRADYYVVERREMLRG
jgi:hypothetical protein